MKKRKHLLPQVNPYFKTNLHTHSTISDGQLTPEELKQAYKALGYQVLCLTDHNTIINHSNMNEPNFLMLTGVEININSPICNNMGGKTYHLNLIAKEPDNLWCPAKIDRWFFVSEEYESKIQYDDMDLQYNAESINAMIAKANEKGFLVTYNHPTWSCQTYPDYAGLKGLWGMELRNTECCMMGHNENNARVYTDMLNNGLRIFPLGTDDTHYRRSLGKSWIMVGATELSYGSIINALEKGDFYMSCGPEIKDLWIEDGILKVLCSDASRINLETHGRFASNIVAEDNTWIREAEIDLTRFVEKANGDPTAYIRLTITAPDGTYAATRAYYLNELV